MRYFVINLDRSKDRLEKINNQADRESIIIERVPAIDCQTLTENELAEKSNILPSFLSNKKSLACSMSHQKIWQKIVDENIEECIIFEDDAIICNNFENELNYVIKQAKKKNNLVDIIHLGDVYDNVLVSYMSSFLVKIVEIVSNHKRMFDLDLFKKFYYKLFSKFPMNIADYFFPEDFQREDFPFLDKRIFLGAHGYYLSNRGAQKLIQLIPKAKWHIDFVISCNLTKLNVFFSKSKLVIQTLSDTLTEKGTSSFNSKMDMIVNLPIFLNLTIKHTLIALFVSIILSLRTQRSLYFKLFITFLVILFTLLILILQDY